MYALSTSDHLGLEYITGISILQPHDEMFEKIDEIPLRIDFYLLLPLECDETIKFTGGSTMAADSNFQACLWFAHSLYSILPGCKCTQRTGVR